MMEGFSSQVGPKTHPATREVLPEDPMEMHGFEVPGDPHLMLRLLVEEYARMGWGIEPVMQLALDPNYQAFHGLLQLWGEEKLRHKIEEVISRCGVIRVKTTEKPVEVAPGSGELVQLDLQPRQSGSSKL